MNAVSRSGEWQVVFGVSVHSHVSGFFVFGRGEREKISFFNRNIMKNSGLVHFQSLAVYLPNGQ